MKEEFTKFNLEDYLTTDELRKEYLNQVLADGDIEEFKRALLFLRRAFADFTSNEKHDIAENIAEIWGLNKNDVSAVINDDLGENEKEIIAGLEEFDFDDI